MITQGWPLVLENDDGMRAIGNPGECFYCKQKIGQPHGQECVCVLKDVEYIVQCDGKRVGIYLNKEEPYFFTEHDGSFHLNESSWCADNAVTEGIVWDEDDYSLGVKKQAEELAAKEEGLCCCDLLEFSFSKIVKPGPYQKEPTK